jgi:HAD superfamily hydrolase (TIGR01509 family)
MNTHTSRPAAVLWDMDGTLVDSEPYWIAAESELARDFGVSWTHEDGLSLVGNPLTVSGTILQDRGVDLPVDEIVDRLLHRVTEQVRESIPWQPDARALLDEVVAAGIPCALVTMSYRTLADAMLAHVPGVFDVVVTGDAVTHGKPHPEPFLTAAQRLGVDIHDCVAIEDSPSGTASAHASGAVTIAVKREADVPSLQGMSRLRTLEGVGVSGLRAFMDGRVIDDLVAIR